jgi:hypothetical protein
MSTSIFTFDHDQKKLHDAIGIKEDYLAELAEKLSNLVKSLKVDTVKEEVIECSPSEIVQAIAEELSYSQLVLVSSFYIRDKIEEMEEKAAERYMMKKGMPDDMPEELVDMVKKFRGRAISSDDLPNELKDMLIKFLEKKRREIDDEDED